MSRLKVILFAGSRTLDNSDPAEHYEPIKRALAATACLLRVESSLIIVRHGRQGYRDRRGVLHGADLLAHTAAGELGMKVDPHPAEWSAPCRSGCRHGPRRVVAHSGGRTICQMAGFYRNQHMVDLEPHPDVYLAFPVGASPGTRDCVRRAKRAGLTEGLYELLSTAGPPQ